ncbi:MAG TPA: AI-2E family transporter [Cytophagaceae bacterium]
MKEYPLMKATIILFFLSLLIVTLYYSRVFLIPVVFASLIAMLLRPLTEKLERVKLGKVPPILISLLIVLGIVTGIGLIFYKQVVRLSQDIVLIQAKTLEKIKKVLLAVEERTSISYAEQIEWLNHKWAGILESGDYYIRSLIFGVTEALAILGIILIYIFFFLLYRKRFKVFILKLFKKEAHSKVLHIIIRIQSLIQQYLQGLLIELTLLGTLNAIGLSILGIKQAVFFGYLAGLLNIIPYVGTLLGGVFPVLMALLFKDSIWYAVGAAAVLSFNQFIDNNFLTPKIVGSHVQVNPLATIMVIIVGGLIWGIPGMILFIPLLGICKIIFDNIEPLKPFGYLLGEDKDNEIPSTKPEPV